MPIKSGFYKGRLGIGLDTTDNAYTSGSDTGIPLYPLDINGDIRITGCIVNKQGNSINLSTSIMQLMDTDTNLSKIDTSVNFNILSTGHLKLPSGTTAQRTATGVLGMLRYNTTTNSFEGYGAGNAWGSLGGVMDIDQDTYITAEQSSDEDKLRFYTGGNEKMLIQNTTNDGIIIKSSIVPDTDSTFDIGSASKKIRHMYISTTSLWIGDEHRISIDNDGTMKFKKRNKNVVPKGLRDALGLDSTAAETKVKADLGITDISTLKLGDWISYSRTHGTGLSNADIKDIFKNEDNEDYEQIDGTVTTVGELNSITNVNTDTKAQGQPLVWNGGTWSASSDINIYNGKVGIGTTSPGAKLEIYDNTVGSSSTLILRRDVSTYGSSDDGAAIEFKTRYTGNSGDYKQTRIRGIDDNLGGQGSGSGGIAFDTYYVPDNNNVYTERMRISGDGNVGIGTTSPNAKLHINGGKLLITDTNGSTAFGRILGGNSDNAHAIHFRVGEDGATDVLDFHEYGKIRFYTNGLLAAQTEKMCILSNGNVGIGTTTPTKLLTLRHPSTTSSTYNGFKLETNGGNKRIIAELSGASGTGDAYICIYDNDGSTTKVQLHNNGNSYFNGGNLGIGTTSPTEKLDVTGNIKASGDVTAHTVSAQNYAVGGTNFISASRQGNFRDLEVKNSSNTETILLTGDGGNISINGTLSADTISEKTSAAGVTIDSVLLKDNTVTAHTVTASNYAVGGTNFISASRQGNFRDLEVKNSSNTATILLTGDGGDISIDGTLSADTISEKTSAAGVTIDSVLLKDNTVTATKFIGDGSELTGVATSGGGGFNWTAQDGTKLISDINLYTGYTITDSEDSNDLRPEKAFDDTYKNTYEGYSVWGSPNGRWNTSTGAYTHTGSTVTNIGTLSGAWLQIDFGKKVKVYHVVISQGDIRSPRIYYIAGSNDNTNWTVVVSKTNADIATNSGNLSAADKTLLQSQWNYQPTLLNDNGSFGSQLNTLSSPTTYRYFRLIATHTYSCVDVHSKMEMHISSLKYYGAFPEQVDKVAVVSGTNMSFVNYKDTISNISLVKDQFYELSTLRLSITPTAVDSVIKLEYSLQIYITTNAAWDIAYIVTRTVNGVETTFSKDPTNNKYYSGFIGNNYQNGSLSFQYNDEPNTTQEVIYKIKFTSTGNTNTMYINRTHATEETHIYRETGVSSASAIEYPKPQQSLTTVTNATQVEGQVLETLAGVCDGRSLSVSSGTYTFPNITAIFTGDMHSSPIDIEGSKINYKPPTGTKTVKYNFYMDFDALTGSTGAYEIIISLFVDNVEITSQNTSFMEYTAHRGQTLDYQGLFEIGGTNDVANGKFSSWDSNKEIKLKIFANGAGYSVELYTTNAENVSGTYTRDRHPLIKPKIEIQAIGTQQYDVVQRVVNYKDGQLLETLAGVCDGRTVAVSSGSYTIPEVTSVLPLTSSYQDIPGSKISYKPPVGTTTIIFNFNALMGYVGAADIHPISHWKLYVDNVEITSFRRSIAAEHMEIPTDIKYYFAIGGVNDVANGKFSTWDTQKEIKLMAREFGNQWEVKLFETFHWDGGEANNFVTPFLEIQAIGRALAPVGNFKIQDVDTITTPPIGGQSLVWDDTNKHWKAGAGGGGGGGGGIQTLSSQPTIANSTAGALYYDTSWKSFFGRMESKWMEMMLEGTPLLFGHPSKIIPKSGTAIVETTATTIEFTWVNPPQYRSCMSAKDTGDYVDAINATNHTSGELYLPAINDIWFQYASNTYKVGGKNIPAAVSGNKLQSLSNISGPKKLTNKVVIITTGSSVPSYASSWTPSTSANGDHYIGLDDNGNQTFIFNPNNTTWSLTAATNYNFKVWLENSTPDSLPPSVSHDSTSTADGTSNLVDTRNYSNHNGISTLEILPPTQIYVADNKLTNGFHVTLTRNGNTHYLTCIVPPEALTGTYNGTDDVKVTTTGDINAMDPVVYYKGFEVQYQTAVASDNFDKATSAIVWTGNWTNVVFSSSSTTNQTGTTFSTDADATNRIASFTPLKPTSIIVASGAGTTPTKNDFTVKKSFTLVQNDNKFYKFRVRAFNQVQINVSDSVWSEKEYVIRFNKPETVTWKGTAAPHLPLFTTKPAQKLHWYITLNWNQQNIKSSVATGNDGTIDEYAHSDLKIHEYKLQRSQDGDTTWETVAYWILPDDNAQMETYDYRIHPPHDDRGETETSNDGNNTKTQEARILAGTRAPQYTFKLQARNWLFGTGIDTGSVPGPRTNYQWARASLTDNRWSAESVSSKTTYSTALIPVAPPKPVIHDNVDDKYAIKFYEMNSTDTKSPWKDGRIASHTDFNAIVDSSLIAARTKEATLQNETPDQDYISYQWKLPYPSEAFKDTLGSSVDRYEIKLEEEISDSTVIAHEVAQTGETGGQIWGWPTYNYVYYFTGTRALSLSGVFEQKNGSNYYWLVKNPLPNGITRVWIKMIWSGYYPSWSSGIGISWRPHNGVGTTAGSLSPNSYNEDTWSPATPDLLPGTEIGIGGGGGINFGLRIYTYSPTSYTPYHTQEIYANDFNYGAANWYLQEYTTNTLLDKPLNYKVKGYNFFVTNPSDYSDPLGTALTSDKPSAPQFLSTAADANKDNSNPTFTLTNDGLTLLVDEPQYTSVDANGNANNFQLESLTIQEFQIQPNIDNSDVDKTLVQDHANTKRGLNLPLEFPAGSTFHTSSSAVHSLDPGDNVWMYLADGTLVAKLTIKQDVQNGWNFEPHNNVEVGSGYSGYLALQMGRLKDSVEYVGGVWPTELPSDNSSWKTYTDDNGLGGGEVGWYLRSQPATNILSQGKDVVASFFHPVTGTTALDEMTTGVVKYKVKAKNVLNSTFSDEAEATLTIGKPNPGTNFKFSPKFTWVQATNKIKLEFFRKYSTTDILFDGSSSTNAPISAVTANCNVTNEIKKLKWNVKCSGATGGTITTSYADVGDTTGYIDSGDNSTSTAAYTISDTGVEHWAIGTDHQVRYRVKNQYNADWFEDPAGSLYSQIKLTAPNAIPSSDISSQISFGLGNTPNKLNILWSKPTEYGLHYKHQGSSSIVAQSNQPNIKTYKVYFNDGTLYYVFSRTATNQQDVSDDATLVSGTTTVEKWTDSSRTTGYESSYTMSVVAGKTYVVEKITAINWLYNTESSFNTPPATIYLNGDSSAPPSQPKVEVESEISSGTTTVPLTNASDLGFEVGQTVEFDNGTNQEQKTISGIASITLNSALSYSYPLGSTIEVIPSSHGGQILSTTAPIPSPFSNYTNQGILISSGSTVRTVKKMGETNNGTALTDVLLNAAAPADTTSTMGIKITISGGLTGESTECKFDSTGIVSGNSLTLIYSGINLATITDGTYSDLYNGATSSADNSGYWFTNSSIKLKWHADASNISTFYGKNLTFNVVVTYYGNNNIVLTRQIETGYYDKTIANPSVTTITPAYTPYTCCGLPILHSTDTLTVATVFNNQSTTWVSSSAVNTITLGGSVASVTTSKSNHTYSGSTVSLAATDMGSYSGASLVKNAQIIVVAKNCNGTGSLTHSSKYIYDPKTLDLITTIAGQNLTTDHISVSNGSETGNASAGVVKMNVLDVPDNFHPTDSTAFTPALLDVTSATVNGKNRLIIYNGKFCSAAYFNQEFGTTYTGYHADVATIGGTQTTTASAGGAFYGAGGAVTTTLENDFRWQIFGMRYKNTSGGGVPITTCEISLGSSSETNITENHLKKYTTNGSDYTHSASSTSDVEFWVKVKIAAGDGLAAYESRWNKLIQNNTNYIGASHGSINNKFNETNSSADRTSSWVGGTLSGNNNNIKLAIRQNNTAFTTPWDIFIAVGMRNNSNVKTFIEVPKTIGKLTSGS